MSNRMATLNGKAELNGHVAVSEAPAKRATKKVDASIPALDIRTIRVRIESAPESPLLMQSFSEKSKTEMLERQMKVAKSGKQARNPVEEFVNALWWMDLGKKPAKVDADADPNKLVRGAKFGIPSRLFKQAIVGAGNKNIGLAKTNLRGAFFVKGKLVGSDTLVEIEGTPTMDERHVRLASGSADLRFRGFFEKWAAVLEIEYDAEQISKEQLCGLISGAGWKQGVCDFRPATCGGDYGKWQIVTE